MQEQILLNGTVGKESVEITTKDGLRIAEQ